MEAGASAVHEKLGVKGHLFEGRWAADLPWAGVVPRVAADAGDGSRDEPGNGTLLRIGYRIDMLAAIMFVMVTFVAMLIHLFSMGYMADELQPIVEDHETHVPHAHLRPPARSGPPLPPLS